MTNFLKKSDREPFIHITKRTDIPLWKAMLFRVVAFLVALLICGIVSYGLTKKDFWGFYSGLFSGAFGTPTKVLNLFEEIAILLCVALALTPAFKMKFWNIGGEGQVLVGALMTATCMLFLKKTVDSEGIIIISFVVSIIAGAIWAVIPAIFKAKWNTNETLFTLMMNYVAMKLISCLLSVYVKDGSGTLKTYVMTAGRLPLIGGNQYLLNIIIVGVLTVLLTIYLKYSKHGYEISVVGESINTAKYVGINVKKVIIRTMLLSGAICGLAGFLLVSGASYTVNPNIASNRGFTAILVSWLASFNPLGMVITAFLVVFLQKGASTLASNYGLGTPYPDVITGIFFICIVAVEFFISYKLNFKKVDFKKLKNKLTSAKSAEEVNK